MNLIKTSVEIEIMRAGGLILQQVMKELIPFVSVGVSTEKIDQKAEQLIRKHNALPSFNTVKDYHWATCLPINDQIVHTRPSSRVLNEGDVLTIDIGCLYEGYHTDYATSFIVGQAKTPKDQGFLQQGKETLEMAIKSLKNGRYLGEVSKTIMDNLNKYGLAVVKELTGHGIGKQLHEDPFIPGWCDRPVEETMIVRPGLVIAIEIIYARGSGKMKYEADNWSIATADHSLSACFEHTVVAQKNSALILT